MATVLAEDFGVRVRSARNRAAAARERVERGRERRARNTPADRPNRQGRAEHRRLDQRTETTVSRSAAGKFCSSINAEVTDPWCSKNCNAPLPNCPDSMCSCEVKERKAGTHHHQQLQQQQQQQQQQQSGRERGGVSRLRRGGSRSRSQEDISNEIGSLNASTLNATDVDSSVCKGNECWPTVFLIGTQKAATTSLTWALSGLLCLATWRPDHVATEVLLPPAALGRPSLGALESKICPEVHAFDAGGEKFEWVSDNTSRYTRLFHPRAGRGREASSCPRHRFLDGTPTMYHWLAAQRMRSILPGKLLGSVRLIAVLRDPIARDLSHYNHVQSDSSSPGGMSNFAQLCDAGSYAANVECELDKWRVCVESMGLSAQNGSYEQYSACPGWDRVMMNGQAIYDEEERLSRDRRRLAHTAGYKKYPLGQLSLLAQDGASSSWAGGASKGGHNLQLAKGMYSAQLRRWRESFRRSQILVVSFEALLDNTTYSSVMHKILTFTGFGGLNDSKLTEYGVVLDELPKENQHNSPTKVTSIPCATKLQLEELYAPWNRELYRMLGEDLDTGNSPEQEAPFPEFSESVACDEE